jgi:CRP-like cAMP-binding protein
MLLQAYQRLGARLAGRTVPGTTKADMVAKVVSNLPSIFAYSDIANACPGVSRPTIMRALTGLREQGLIVCTRKGRNALWRKCDHGAQE